jgi:hypothetical protein
MSFKEAMSEDQRHTDDVICLPDIDSLTDDEGPDDVIEIVDIQGMPGTLEIHYLSLEACEDTEQVDLLSTATCEVSKSKLPKKRYLSDDLSEWSETALSCRKLSAKGNQAGMRWRT